MKKIWLMLLMICSVCAFSACSNDDDEKKDDEEKVCPVTNIVMSKTAEVGETIKITGEGFATTAKLTLQNEAGDNVDMEATINSDKEVTCIIPTIEAGKYKVILTQNGTWEIGTIEISVSERTPRVKQMLFDYGWKISTYSFEYNEEGRISKVNYYMEDIEEPMVYEITYENDRIIVSNFQDFTYNLENGQVVSTSYDDGDGLVDWPWRYNENNYLTFGGYEEVAYIYTENNLTAIGYDALASYEGAQYENKFELIDPVVCMFNTFAYALEGDIIDLIAHWLGICGKSSTYLPVRMTNDYGDSFPIQYTMDSKYPQSISEAKLQSEESTYIVKFIYE